MFINRTRYFSSQRRSLWEQPKNVGDYKVAVPTTLCHRCSHASLSFHTVTLRFLGTELICITRVRCVHRFLFSCSLPRSIFLRGVILACQFTAVYSQKVWKWFYSFRRLLVNVENMLDKIIKFSKNLKAERKRDLQQILRYRLFPLTKMFLRSSLLISAIKLKVSGTVVMKIANYWEIWYYNIIIARTWIPNGRTE